MSKFLVVLTLTLLSCLGQPTNSLRILAIFPLNSKSHDVVCDRLARGLAVKGHHVDVYSNFPPKKFIENYKHHSFEGILTDYTNNMSYDQAANFKPQSLREIMNNVGVPACELMELPMFQELLKSPPRYDVVIVEGFIAECYLAWGRHLNLPTIAVMPTAVLDWYIVELGNPFNPAVTPLVGASVFAPMSFTDRLRNFLVSVAGRWLFTQAVRDQNRLIERFFGPGYPDIVQLRRDLDLVIVNSHHSFDGVRPFTSGIVPAAGMHVDDEDDTELPADVRKWLDDSEHGCVYFSFGSMILIESFPEPIVRAFYASFRNIAPVRVLLKVANPKALPPGLPTNVMMKSWFSQVQILKHKNTKVFVTHGGMMSAQESVHFGVPMVGIPVFGDQFDNVEANVRRGIATSIQLKDVDEEKLTATVKAVLDDPTFEQNAARLSRRFTDRPMTPLDTAIYWVEYVARHGKGCLRSPLVDMPWWQADLLDIYAFVVLAIGLVCFVFKWLATRLWRVCWSSGKTKVAAKSKKMR